MIEYTSRLWTRYGIGCTSRSQDTDGDIVYSPVPEVGPSAARSPNATVRTKCHNLRSIKRECRRGSSQRGYLSINIQVDAAGSRSSKDHMMPLIIVKGHRRRRALIERIRGPCGIRRIIIYYSRERACAVHEDGGAGSRRRRGRVATIIEHVGTSDARRMLEPELNGPTARTVVVRSVVGTRTS